SGGSIWPDWGVNITGFSNLPTLEFPEASMSLNNRDNYKVSFNLDNDNTLKLKENKIIDNTKVTEIPYEPILGSSKKTLFKSVSITADSKILYAVYFRSENSGRETLISYNMENGEYNEVISGSIQSFFVIKDGKYKNNVLTAVYGYGTSYRIMNYKGDTIKELGMFYNFPAYYTDPDRKNEKSSQEKEELSQDKDEETMEEEQEYVGKNVESSKKNHERSAAALKFNMLLGHPTSLDADLEVRLSGKNSIIRTYGTIGASINDLHLGFYIFGGFKKEEEQAIGVGLDYYTSNAGALVASYRQSYRQLYPGVNDLGFEFKLGYGDDGYDYSSKGWLYGCSIFMFL
ncbi:MAG: hypothetical protein ACOCP4_04215, partial [Candidatus Woesearchaeota archaeon]